MPPGTQSDHNVAVVDHFNATVTYVVTALLAL